MRLITKSMSEDEGETKFMSFFSRCPLTCRMSCWWVCRKQILMWWIIYCGERPHNAREFLPFVSLCIYAHAWLLKWSDSSTHYSSWSQVFLELSVFVQTYPSINILRLLCLHREPSLRSEESFSLTDRRLSSDSHKPSSGEVSPYDNNSPVLSDRPRFKYTEDGSLLSDRVPRQDKLRDQSKDNSGSTSPTLSTDKGEQNSFQP